VHSHAGDDPIQCRDYVREKTGLPAFRPDRSRPRDRGNGNGNGTLRRRLDAAEIGRMLQATIQGQTQVEGPRIIKTYDYTDEAGTAIYQVCRLDPKDFRQRRPDGNGGWIWKLGDVRRVLYKLPELLQFPHATVFICEGEKDADRVASLKHCATTAGGRRLVEGRRLGARRPRRVHPRGQ
jgi:hypothetical protein